jgi:hypothetical protein
MLWLMAFSNGKASPSRTFRAPDPAARYAPVSFLAGCMRAQIVLQRERPLQFGNRLKVLKVL